MCESAAGSTGFRRLIKYSQIFANMFTSTMDKLLYYLFSLIFINYYKKQNDISYVILSV